MHNGRLENMNNQPSQIILISGLVETPVPLIGNSVLVKTFRHAAPCFTYSDGGFAKAPKDFGKVNRSESEPLLEVRTPLEPDRMMGVFASTVGFKEPNGPPTARAELLDL